MGALSLIDRLGLADEVMAMRGAGKSQAEIAAWVTAASRNESVTQAAVSRWLASRAEKARPAAPSAPTKSETAERLQAIGRKLKAVSRVKVDRGGQDDARYFLDAARALVDDLREIYQDTAQHPQLRATALTLSLETVATGHGMAVDLLELTSELNETEARGG